MLELQYVNFVDTLRKFTRWVKIFLLALTLGLFCSFATAQDSLLLLLKNGGYNIFFRHAKTDGLDPHKKNPPNETPYNCASQRPLNDAGRAQAQEIGRRFSELLLPVGDVYSSPVCRCEETAKLAFGKVTTVDWMVVRRGQFLSKLDKELRSVPSTGIFTKTPTGKNNIYVGHNITFTEFLVGKEFGRPSLEEGEALVIEPGEPPKVLGRIKFY
jgi:hypothetical protein